MKNDKREINVDDITSGLQIQLFDTFRCAQGAVETVTRRGEDLSKDDDNFAHLQREYTVCKAICETLNQQSSNALLRLIRQTDHQMASQCVTNIHKTQIWAAAVAAMYCQRMLDNLGALNNTIPEETKADIQNQVDIHTGMWEKRLNDSPNQ